MENNMDKKTFLKYTYTFAHWSNMPIIKITTQLQERS